MKAFKRSVVKNGAYINGLVSILWATVLQAAQLLNRLTIRSLGHFAKAWQSVRLSTSASAFYLIAIMASWHIV